MSKLVYLDSAQFDWLERAPSNKRREFLNAWAGVGAELALSLHHLQEMGQLRDADSLQQRLGVLKLFPVVRCGPVSSEEITRREIRMLLQQQSTSPSDDVWTADRWSLFPECDLEDVIASTLQFQSVFHLFRDALKEGAVAENLSKAARPKKPLKIPDNFDWAAMKAEWPSTIDEVSAQMPEIPIEIWSAFRAMLPQFTGHSSVRSMLVTQYQLSAIETIDRIPDDDLVSAHIFYSAARDEFSRIAMQLELQSSDCEDVISKIRMYDAPGFALKVALRRARRPHPREAEPGDQTDEDHVAFTPYVDLLFADKRTVSFLQQEARRAPNPLPQALVARVRKAADLDDIVEQITGLGD